MCLLKGKYRITLLGIFIPPLALIGAIRLALPTSRWARRWYSPRRLARARAGSQARCPVGTDHEVGRLRRCRQADRTRIQGATDRHRETVVVLWMMVEGRRLSQLGISSSHGSTTTIQPRCNLRLSSDNGSRSGTWAICRGSGATGRACYGASSIVSGVHDQHFPDRPRRPTSRSSVACLSMSPEAAPARGPAPSLAGFLDGSQRDRAGALPRSGPRFSSPAAACDHPCAVGMGPLAGCQRRRRDDRRVAACG